MTMARFRYLGGDQRPDDYGVLEVGDVLEFAQAPEWGDWESTTKAAGRASTPQPNYANAEPEPLAKASAADDTAKEA
jgi:hypothetical protein